MPKGKVKEYDPNRGCGTIVDSESGQKLTVYANYIDPKEGRTLKQDQEVEYDIGNSQQKDWALNVRVL